MYFLHQATPLHLAAHNGYAEIVKQLLERGADISERDAEGNNALDTAIDRGHR